MNTENFIKYLKMVNILFERIVRGVCMESVSIVNTSTANDE